MQRELCFSFSLIESSTEITKFIPTMLVITKKTKGKKVKTKVKKKEKKIGSSSDDKLFTRPGSF